MIKAKTAKNTEEELKRSRKKLIGKEVTQAKLELPEATKNEDSEIS